MCCSIGNGCGCCGGSNLEINTESREGRSLEKIARELGSAALLVKGFLHSDGNWLSLVDSICGWERERLGCCQSWISRLVDWFQNCGGDNGEITRDELHAVFQVLCAEHGVATVCLTLERLAGSLEEICHKSKVEVEEILTQYCREASLDIQNLQAFWLYHQGTWVETAVRHGSLTDPTLRDPVQLCNLIQRVCAAAGVTGVVTEAPRRASGTGDSNDSEGNGSTSTQL